jgi:hypothetical protein
VRVEGRKVFVDIEQSSGPLTLRLKLQVEKKEGSTTLGITFAVL